jgi:hypothetical protein
LANEKQSFIAEKPSFPATGALPRSVTWGCQWLVGRVCCWAYIFIKKTYFPVGGHTLKACNHTYTRMLPVLGGYNVFSSNTRQVWVFEENSESKNRWFWVFEKKFKIKEPLGPGI